MSRLEEIIQKHPAAYKAFTDDDADLMTLPEFYTDLYEYYLSSGEMPYGVAKARTGDPYNWIAERLDAHATGW